MTILLSNDDGVFASGLSVLHQSLSKHGKCMVIAPDRDCSGRSNALTLDRPVRVSQLANGFYSVNGTPVDCVYLALHQLLDTPPKVVISGINHGANLGDDVLYSGTVAAAFEGRFIDQITLAVSLCGKGDQALKRAGGIVSELFERLPTHSLPRGTVLNINIPACETNSIQGIKVTRLGSRGVPAPPIETTDPKGQRAYWIGKVGKPLDDGEGTDFHAVAHGYVSITPLSFDQTHHALNPQLKQWLDLE